MMAVIRDGATTGGMPSAGDEHQRLGGIDAHKEKTAALGGPRRRHVMASEG